MDRLGVLQLTVLSIAWGAAYLVIAVALDGYPPAVVVAGRALVAAAILLPIAVRRGALTSLTAHPWWVTGTVLVQSTAPLLLLTFGQQRLSTGLTGILIGSQPLWVALVAPSERPTGSVGIAGLALGFSGLVLIFGIDIGGSSQALAGGILVTAAAICYACGSVLIHRKLSGFAQPLGVATAAMVTTTAVAAAPAAAAVPQHISVAPTIAVLALGAVFTAATLVLNYSLISRSGPGPAALAFYLAPSVTVFLGWLLRSEPLTWSTTIGLIAIVGGSALAATSTPRPHKPAPQRT